MARELNADEVAKLKQPRPRKQRVEDPSNRTTDGWFKLLHTWQKCDVPDHIWQVDRKHPEEPDKYPKGRMCATIDKRYVCRFCYLDKKDIRAWGEEYWVHEDA